MANIFNKDKKPCYCYGIKKSIGNYTDAQCYRRCKRANLENKTNKTTTINDTLIKLWK